MDVLKHNYKTQLFYYIHVCLFVLNTLKTDVTHCFIDGYTHVASLECAGSHERRFGKITWEVERGSHHPAFKHWDSCEHLKLKSTCVA